MKSQDFAPDPYTTGAQKVCALLFERFKGTEHERNLGAAMAVAMTIIQIEQKANSSVNSQHRSHN